MARLALPADFGFDGVRVVTLEGALVVALSISSTTAVGLDLGGEGGATAATPTTRATAALVLVGNVVLLPLVAWLVVGAFGLGAAGVGVLLAAALPGGSTGPLLASLAGGDVRVAARWFVTLMLVGTGLALLATLALAPGGVGRVLQAAAIVFAVSVVPLAIARAAARRGWTSRSWAKAASRVSLVLLLATIGLLLVRHVASAQAASLVASAVIVVVGLAASALLRVDRPTRAAIVQVGAVRNLTLALVVMEVVGAAPAARVAALGYGLVMFVVAGGVAGWTRYAARR